MSNFKLREVIKQIRQCKTAAEERAVISKESALIRNAFKEKDCEHRNRNIAKLLFFNLLGYPTHFGQIECVKLVASGNFTEKRIGYLGLSQLMDESSDILILVTSSIKKDLNEKGNNFVIALALTAIAEISTDYMCRELYPDVKRLMKSSSSYLKQKAILAAIRTLKNIPDTIEDFLDIIDQLVYDKSHSVIMATVTLMCEILRIDDSYVKHFRKYVSTLVRTLKNLLMSGYNPEYEIGGVKDPFLQVKILQLLKQLGQGNSEASDEMSDILAQIATNTESSKNPGNSVLSECVRTIMGIEASQGLRVLGINILGRFLMNKENNVRFVALQSLQQVVDIDYQAVQRHKATITDCLKDHDLVIKKKALDLLYKITNQSNVKSIVKELINYLLVAESEFKKELSNKICMACEKYAPNKKWHIDTVLKVLTLSEGHVREEYISQIITVIATTPELHHYSVTKAYYAMKENLNQIGMVQLGVWLVGEFGEMLVNGTSKDTDNNPIIINQDEILELLESILDEHNKKGERSDTIISWVLTALAKLTIRLKGVNTKVKELIDQYTDHMNVEIQQRACEYLQIFDQEWDQQDKIFDPIPFKGDENMLVDATGRAIVDDEEGDLLVSRDEEKAQKQKNKETQIKMKKEEQEQQYVIDIDGILDGGGSSSFGGSTLNNQQQQQQNNKQGQDQTGDDDLLGNLMKVFETPSIGSQQQNQFVNQNSGNFGNSIDAIFGSQPVIPSQPTQINNIFGGNSGDIFSPQSNTMNIFGGGSAISQPQQQQPSIPYYVAYEDSNLKISFQLKRENMNQHNIRCIFTNKVPMVISQLNLQVAVQKYMKLNILPATSNELQPLALQGATQDMNIINTLEGQKPLALKIRILYALPNGDKCDQTKILNDLPTSY